MRCKKSGFTLIELMIVVGIIGILAAIAYPSYVDYVRKTRFAQAKEGAMEVASALERSVSQKIAYPASLEAASISKPYNPEQLAYDYSPIPDANGVNRSYTLSVKESTLRFGIWVGINPAGSTGGTHCGCDGKVCTVSTAGAFSETQTSCVSPTVAF